MAETKKPAAKKSTTESKPAGSSKPAGAASNRNLLIIGGAVVIGLLVLAVLFLGKKGAELAAYMPADASVFFQIDLNKLTSPEMQEIAAAFQAASGETPTEGENVIEQEIATELDMNFEEDIAPWLGNHFAAAGMDVADGENFLMAIESTNPTAADAFIDKRAANVEADGGSVSSIDFNGTRIIVTDTEFDDSALARAGNVVLVADSAATIQAALELQASESLASMPEFQAAMGELPAGQMVTVYVDLNQMSNSLAAISDVGAPAEATLPASSRLAAGISVVPAGLQFDVVYSLNEAELGAPLVNVYKALTGPLRTLEKYPEDVLLFYGARLPSLDPASLTAYLGEEAYQDFKESIDSLKSFNGLDLNSLIDAIGDEISLALFSQEGGVGAFSGGFGLQLLVTLREGANLNTFFEGLNPLVASEMELSPEAREISGMPSFVVTVPLMGELAAYGSGSGLGFLTTDPSIIEDFSDSSFVSFIDSEAYKQAKAALPGNANLAIYVNVAGLISVVETAMGTDASISTAARPLTAVAGGILPYKAGVFHTVFIAFIDR